MTRAGSLRQKCLSTTLNGEDEMVATLSKFFVKETLEYLRERYPDIFFLKEDGETYARFDQVEVLFIGTHGVQITMRNKGRPVSVHRYEIDDRTTDISLELLGGTTLNISNMWENQTFEQEGEVSVEIGVVG